MTHRRDWDVLLATGPVLDRTGLRLRRSLPYFVSREDILRPHFLREYLKRLPQGLRAALDRFPLSPVLWAIRARPIRRVPERTLGEVLEDILVVRGDLPLYGVLREPALKRYHDWPGVCRNGMRVREALENQFRPLLKERYGLLRLQRTFFKELKPYQRSVIQAQLDSLTELLEAGEMLVLAPEGTVSPDGSVSRIRGALHHLVNAPRTPVRVLPVGITYDFMSTSRLDVFVDYGPELVDLRGRSRRQVSELMRLALRRRLTVTATQLVSEHLLELRERGIVEVDAALLEDRVGEEALRYQRAQASVDPRLLASAARRRRLKSLLRWCVREGVLDRVGGKRYRMRGNWNAARPTFRSAHGAFSYAANELAALSEVYPRVRGAR